MCNQEAIQKQKVMWLRITFFFLNYDSSQFLTISLLLSHMTDEEEIAQAGGHFFKNYFEWPLYYYIKVILKPFPTFK